MMWLAIGIAVLGTLADWYTTERGLGLGLREANPVARYLMDQTGSVFAATVLADGAILGLASWGFYALGGTDAVRLFLYVAGGMQLVAAGLNWRLIRKRLEKRRG